MQLTVNAVTGATNASIAVGAIGQDASNANTASRIDSSVAIPPQFVGTHAIAAGTVGVALFSDSFVVPNTTTFSMQLDVWCGQLPNQALGPCCAPDERLVAQINSILTAVTLLQRQTAPFGYVYGANHTALSGDGSIAVSDLIGVSIDVTTLPGSYGEMIGTPTELFGLGFVTLGTADGWESSRRIDHDGTLFLPGAAGVFTLIGYTLRPGVVVSIRELIREP
jgi:hypothetical protein